MSNHQYTSLYKHKPGDYISIQIPVTADVHAEKLFSDIGSAVHRVTASHGYDNENDEHAIAIFIMDTLGNAVY